MTPRVFAFALAGFIAIEGYDSRLSTTPRQEPAWAQTMPTSRRPAREQIRDKIFDPTFDAKASVTDEVKTIAIQSDGRILVGGSNGLLKRLMPNGSNDSSFVAPSFRGASINAIAIQPGGQILVGGTLLRGNSQSFLRLTADGALDSTFRPPQLIGTVEEIVVQPDGQILVGGSFRVDRGTPRDFLRNLVRLSDDGPVVDDFRPEPRGTVRAIELLPDGRLLIGGAFGDVGGFRLANLALLSRDGVLDKTFDPNPRSGDVFSIASLSDGRILIGGGFTTVDGMERRGLARLSPSGELDGSFDPSIPDRVQVHTVALQDDGKILAGGLYLAMRAGAVTVHTLVRLLPNGQLDTGFVPFTTGFPVNDIARQSDGRFLVGGRFTDGFTNDFGRIVRLP